MCFYKLQPVSNTRVLYFLSCRSTFQTVFLVVFTVAMYMSESKIVLQPSSPLGHACELKDILKLCGGNKALVRAFSRDGLAEMKLNYIIA